MNIRFYKTKDEYGCFSNFSKHPIELKGYTWPTTEHYYQAQKFEGTDHETEIRLAKSAWVAAKQGRERHRPLRDDWESIKEQVMYDALMAKFTQNEDAKQVLLSTGDNTLIEDSPVDWYWGCGANGKGKNRLGILLMRLRDELRKEIV
jgi:ribA/ribD-fused uncharacterized protein